MNNYSVSTSYVPGDLQRAEVNLSSKDLQAKEVEAKKKKNRCTIWSVADARKKIKARKADGEFWEIGREVMFQMRKIGYEQEIAFFFPLQNNLLKHSFSLLYTSTHTPDYPN